jgi:hypothetical protein
VTHNKIKNRKENLEYMKILVTGGTGLAPHLMGKNYSQDYKTISITLGIAGSLI